MKPYKIYTLYYGKRDATTADYFLDDTANIPVGMGYYMRKGRRPSREAL